MTGSGVPGILVSWLTGLTISQSDISALGLLEPAFEVRKRKR